MQQLPGKTPSVEPTPAEQLPAGHFVVSPDILISHIWQVCEMVLNIPLEAVDKEEKQESIAVSSSIATLAMNKNNQQNCLLIMKCDDSLLDAIFEKNMAAPSTTDTHIKTLNVLSKLASILSEELTNIFQNNPHLHFPTPPKHAKNGTIAEVVLKHSSGFFHIFLTTLESSSNTPLSNPDLDKFFLEIGA